MLPGGPTAPPEANLVDLDLVAASISARGQDSSTGQHDWQDPEQ